jgi:kelch-like protein 10
MCSGEKYNPESNTWSPLPDMHSARSNFAVEVIDDRIFALGGFDGLTAIDHVEFFDETADAWFVYS